MDSEFELNTSWENEYIRTTQGEVTYSPEPMNNVRAHILYINPENKVQHSISKIIPLDVISHSTGSQLSESSLMQFIQSNREFNQKRYQCDGISHYCLTIDPTPLFKQILTPEFSIDSKPYFTSFDIPRTITFPPSLFVFHSLNGIWFIFRELILIEEPKKLVSIIKKTIPSSSQKPKKTKRVRISNDLPTMSKTRKRL
jgi:hypothetical protein